MQSASPLPSCIVSFFFFFFFLHHDTYLIYSKPPLTKLEPQLHKRLVWSCGRCEETPRFVFSFIRFWRKCVKLLLDLKASVYLLLYTEPSFLILLWVISPSYFWCSFFRGHPRCLTMQSERSWLETCGTQDWFCFSQSLFEGLYGSPKWPECFFETFLIVHLHMCTGCIYKWQ